jgi:hypothetical protein
LLLEFVVNFPLIDLEALLPAPAQQPKPPSLPRKRKFSKCVDFDDFFRHEEPIDVDRVSVSDALSKELTTYNARVQSVKPGKNCLTWYVKVAYVSPISKRKNNLFFS